MSNKNSKYYVYITIVASRQTKKLLGSWPLTNTYETAKAYEP